MKSKDLRFIAGFVLLVAGVACMSFDCALVVGGLVLMSTSVLVAIGQKAKEPPQPAMKDSNKIEVLTEVPE